jgi:hypothetical protein
MLKKLVSKAPVSFKISPYSVFSRYSNISKKKGLIKTFLDSMDNSSDEDEENY